MISDDNAKTLGYGGFGKVSFKYSAKFNKKVAIKEISKQALLQKKELERMDTIALLKIKEDFENMFRKEKNLMLQLKEKHLDYCVEILEFIENPPTIIMEYCEGGDIRKLLDEEREVDVGDKVVMIGQILEAIKQIHGAGFIHGDLKCQNIFLVNKYIPKDTDNIEIKIGDFGLSEKGGKLIWGGIPGYQAPENRVNGSGGSFESDFYSIGKVMLEIMKEHPVYII